MGFKKINYAIYYCSEPGCHAWYTWEDEGDPRPGGNTILPCGHQLARATLSGVCIKGGDRAIDMLDYLHKNHMIKLSAYDKIKELRGKLDDGLNCRLPERDLDEEELERMDWGM